MITKGEKYHVTRVGSSGLVLDTSSNWLIIALLRFLWLSATCRGLGLTLVKDCS